MNGRPNRFERKPVAAGIIVTLLCLGAVEIVIRIGVAWNVLPYRVYPTNREPQFWADIDPVVGRWRYPNATFRNVFPCFDETYRTNSVGARDPERALRSAAPQRVVVLGDSFTEGWGVARGDRISDILEAETGIEHLNFGTSSWGTIQQWLYYREYAQHYDHSAVFLLLWPANDFHDNDPDHQNPGLYRPYLRKTADGHEVWYTVAFDRRFTGANSAFEIVKNTIDNNWYLANILRTAVRLIKDDVLLDATGPDNDYDNFTATDIDRLLFVLGEITTIAGDRPFYIITIPSERDVAFAQRQATGALAAGPSVARNIATGKTTSGFHLIDTLETFAADAGNVQIIDLLPAFIADAEATGRSFGDYTHGCDYHWSATGNRVAARALLELIYPQSME